MNSHIFAFAPALRRIVAASRRFPAAEPRHRRCAVSSTRSPRRLRGRTSVS